MFWSPSILPQMGAVTRLVSCYQVLRFCEDTRPVSMDEHVDLLVSQFNLCQGAVLDVAPTESRPPDMFMVMAAHQLWSEWQKTGQDRWFLKAITLLEFALQFSPHNFHIRLVLIKLYNEAGMRTSDLWARGSCEMFFSLYFRRCGMRFQRLQWSGTQTHSIGLHGIFDHSGAPDLWPFRVDLFVGGEHSQVLQ